MDALSLKIDSLQSLTRQLGKEIAQTSASIDAFTAAAKIQASDYATMKESLDTLIEELTREPEEGENLGDLLRQIHKLCEMIYARLPNSARN